MKNIIFAATLLSLSSILYPATAMDRVDHPAQDAAPRVSLAQQEHLENLSIIRTLLQNDLGEAQFSVRYPVFLAGVNKNRILFTNAKMIEIAKEYADHLIKWGNEEKWTLLNTGERVLRTDKQLGRNAPTLASMYLKIAESQKDDIFAQMGFPNYLQNISRKKPANIFDMIGIPNPSSRNKR